MTLDNSSYPPVFYFYFFNFIFFFYFYFFFIFLLFFPFQTPPRSPARGTPDSIFHKDHPVRQWGPPLVLFTLAVILLCWQYFEVIVIKIHKIYINIEANLDLLLIYFIALLTNLSLSLSLFSSPLLSFFF